MNKIVIMTILYRKVCSGDLYEEPATGDNKDYDQKYEDSTEKEKEKGG